MALPAGKECLQGAGLEGHGARTLQSCPFSPTLQVHMGTYQGPGCADRQGARVWTVTFKPLPSGASLVPGDSLVPPTVA